MNWREKWQDKTRGGFEVLDVRDHPRNDARLLVAMWVGTGHEVLQYERAMNGQYYRTEYSDFDLLPITPPAEQQGGDDCEFGVVGPYVCNRGTKGCTVQEHWPPVDQPDLADIRRDAERLASENGQLRLMLQASRHLICAAKGPEGGPTSWAETRDRLFAKIDALPASTTTTPA